MATEAIVAMTTREKILLENVLDALDRLFDRQSSVVDIQSLLLATSEALSSTCHEPLLRTAERELQTIIRSTTSEEERRDRALLVTNDLRIDLAQKLPID
ncbi:MAG TPA: hypothetical protein VNQ76_07375 [Planctomicrobium sp.]|nr:hypothetical protein [Planctomicrobium sp.]